jgi:hypothetical protein
VRYEFAIRELTANLPSSWHFMLTDNLSDSERAVWEAFPRAETVDFRLAEGTAAAGAPALPFSGGSARCRRDCRAGWQRCRCTFNPSDHAELACRGARLLLQASRWTVQTAQARWTAPLGSPSFRQELA